MKLSYRGVHYEGEPSTLKVTEGRIAGSYRGQSWRFHHPQYLPKLGSVDHLKYRGVAYRTGQATPVKPRAVLQPLTARWSFPWFNRPKRQPVQDEIVSTHLDNIQHSLEHRLRVARARGDENLVRLLEEEKMALHL